VAVRIGRGLRSLPIGQSRREADSQQVAGGILNTDELEGVRIENCGRGGNVTRLVGDLRQEVRPVQRAGLRPDAILELEYLAVRKARRRTVLVREALQVAVIVDVAKAAE